MLACEAFLRRAAQLTHPFMLKGSYVTRQYLSDPLLRLPADLDWVYLEKRTDAEETIEHFNTWVKEVCAQYADDGFLFEGIDAPCWGAADYMMADDFPTVTTELHAYNIAEAQKVWISFDISFNLDLDVPPLPLQYRPLEGPSFTIPYTVPLPVQVAWKLHQCLVRLRFKDLYDLLLLLQLPAFDHAALQQCLQTLVNECAADNIPPQTLRSLFSGNWGKLGHSKDIKDDWEFWRYGIKDQWPTLTRHAAEMTDATELPENLNDFKKLVLDTLSKAGLDLVVLDKLPRATRKKRKTYEPE